MPHSLSALAPYALFAAFAALAIGSFVLYWWLQKRRREQLAAAATRLGLTFDPAGLAFPGSRFASLPLFGQGRSRHAQNVLSGRLPEAEIHLLDYRFTTGSGKHQHRHTQTVAAFMLPGPAYPTLQLRPEGLLHKLGQAFGYQDLDFASHPRFSAKYLVRGPDEPAIRSLLAPVVLDHLEARPGWTVEAGGPVLIVYKPDRTVSPDKLDQFMQDTMGVFYALGMAAGYSSATPHEDTSAS